VSCDSSANGNNPDGVISKAQRDFLSLAGRNLHLLTLLLTGALVCFISEAEASHHLQTPVFSQLPLQAGLRCGLVNGHIDCGNTNDGGKHHNNDDEHHGKNDTTITRIKIPGSRPALFNNPRRT
jgi:hypothetical protein